MWIPIDKAGLLASRRLYLGSWRRKLYATSAARRCYACFLRYWPTYVFITIAGISITLFCLSNAEPRKNQVNEQSAPSALFGSGQDDSLSVEDMRFAAEQEYNALRKAYDRFTPKSAYMVINSSQNEFRLYANNGLVREGKCSTGSYIRLESDHEKHWIFRTPKGIFRIRGKTRNPVWKKPDWVFVEEGKPIPSANHPSRYEYGVLGDYALSLGDGYLIHGTLYTRLLGMPVTHGCIRLGDDDLKAVYNTLKPSDKVFIY